MRIALLTVVAAAAISFSGVAAQAVPAMPAAAVAAAPEVTMVSGGCGPFAHRGRFGYCRPGGGYGVPFYGPRPFYYGHPGYYVYRRPFYGYRRYYY